jgi:hypothetical protein
MDRTHDMISNSMNAGLNPALYDVRELVGFAPEKLALSYMFILNARHFRESKNKRWYFKSWRIDIVCLCIMVATLTSKDAHH